MANAVNWFEIPANNFDRAVEFYSSLFQYEFHKVNMMGTDMAFFPGDTKNQGATGAIVKGEGYAPTENGSLIYFVAGDDLNTVLERVEAAGGKITLPKTPIGENGFIAHLIDTEGNKIGLHSMN